MSKTDESTHCTVREVVGVFETPDALEEAVDNLENAGVSRAAISVLGTHPKRSAHVETLYRSAEEIADDPAAQRAAFVSSDSRTEGKALAIALPFQVGAYAGVWAVVAAGGALARALALRSSAEPPGLD